MIEFGIGVFIGFTGGAILMVKRKQNKDMTTEDCVNILKKKGYGVRLYTSNLKGD